MTKYVDENMDKYVYINNKGDITTRDGSNGIADGNYAMGLSGWRRMTTDDLDD